MTWTKISDIQPLATDQTDQRRGKYRQYQEEEAMDKHQQEPTCPICKGYGWYIKDNLPVEHPQFGQAVRCTCATALTTRKARQQLGKYATCSFDNFDTRWDAKHVAALTRVRAAAFNYTANLGSDWLYIYGSPGSGKTHLAAACMLYASEQREVRFWHVQDLLDAIKADKFAQQDIIMREVFGVSLLVLDDLGAEHNTTWVQGILLRIVTKRDQFGLPLIMTSNVLPHGMEERVRDRILGRSMPIKMPPVNYREAHAEDWLERD